MLDHDAVFFLSLEDETLLDKQGVLYKRIDVLIICILLILEPGGLVVTYQSVRSAQLHHQGQGDNHN